jgi:hypothetical protein
VLAGGMPQQRDVGRRRCQPGSRGEVAGRCEDGEEPAGCGWSWWRHPKASPPLSTGELARRGDDVGRLDARCGGKGKKGGEVRAGGDDGDDGGVRVEFFLRRGGHNNLVVPTDLGIVNKNFD